MNVLSLMTSSPQVRVSQPVASAALCLGVATPQTRVNLQNRNTRSNPQRHRYNEKADSIPIRY